MFLETLNLDCLQTIASLLDPASLVSLSLTNTLFKCDIVLEDDAGDPRSGKYGLWPLPKTVMADGILVEAIKYNYHSLFDYWSPLVTLFEEMDIGDTNINEMIKNAGRITPKEASLAWIGKIFMFIFSRPVLAQLNTADNQWNSYYSGILKTNDVEHYLALGDARLEWGSDEDRKEAKAEDVRQALKRGAINIADHIMRQNTDTDFFDFHNTLFIAASKNPKSLKWILDKAYTAGLDKHRRLIIFWDILNSVRTTETAQIAITHPLVTDISDEELLNEDFGPVVESRDVIAVLLSHRPKLLEPLSLYLNFWTKGVLDKRFLPYLGSLTEDDVMHIARTNCKVSITSIEEIIVAAGITLNYKRPLFETLLHAYSASETINLFKPKAPEEMEIYIDYITKNYFIEFSDLIGENVFPDETILRIVREQKSKQPKSKKASAKKVPPKRGRPRGKPAVDE